MAHCQHLFDDTELQNYPTAFIKFIVVMQGVVSYS